MVSDYRDLFGLPSTQFLHSSSTIDSSSHPLRSGHELGRMHHQRLHGDQHEPHPRPQFQPHPLSSTQSHNLHEAILREIEKENIRQEIIMSEIIKMRALEAEVNYEIRMEMAMAIERRRNGFPYEAPLPLGLDLPARFPLAQASAESRFLEERIIYPPQPRNTLNNLREGSGSNYIPEAKLMINITGAKRARAGSGSDGNLKKKVKEAWSCALCQVSVGSECYLNMHLAGKKHKRVEAALDAQKARKKKSRIPLSEITKNGVKLTSESLLLGMNGDAGSARDGPSPLDGKLNSDNSKKKKKKKKKKAAVKPQEVPKKNLHQNIHINHGQ